MTETEKACLAFVEALAASGNHVRIGSRRWMDQHGRICWFAGVSAGPGMKTGDPDSVPTLFEIRCRCGSGMPWEEHLAWVAFDDVGRWVEIGSPTPLPDDFELVATQAAIDREIIPKANPGHVTPRVSA